MTLAERIDNVVKDFDPWGYRDSECSLEYFEELLKKNPEVIIEGLLEQISLMQENIDDLEICISKLLGELEEKK